MSDEPAVTRTVRPRQRRTLLAVLTVVVGALASAISPWPSSLLIRWVFTAGADATVNEMVPYVPDVPLTEHLDIAYTPGGEDTTLDVFAAADGSDPLTTIVWIHRGAWISGDKRDVAPYLRILAAEGYTTVGLNYAIAPEVIYPGAVEQLNSALEFLLDNAAEYRIDPAKIVLAGDSAGAQLASQRSPGSSRYPCTQH